MAWQEEECEKRRRQQEDIERQRRQAEELGARSWWKEYHESTTMHEVSTMDGTQFEKFLARLFSKMGYSEIRFTPTNDQGGDLLCLAPGGASVVIQAKRWISSVGNDAVQEALAARVYYDCDGAMVVTNSVFTDAARDLANKAGVALHDKEWLAAQIKAFLPPEIPEFNWDEYHRIVRGFRTYPRAGRSSRSKYGRGGRRRRYGTGNAGERQEKGQATEAGQARSAAHEAREAAEQSKRSHEDQQRQERQKHPETQNKRQRQKDRESKVAERIEQWKQSGMPRDWVLEHLDGWDQPEWVAMVVRVKATPFWPLDMREMESYLESLRVDLWLERARQRQEQRPRQAEPMHQQSPSQEPAQRMEQWKRSGLPRAWVIEHLGGWDESALAALLNQVKSSAFWPLDIEEIITYLTSLRSELQTEIMHQAREAERLREAQRRNRADESSREAQEGRQRVDEAAKRRRELAERERAERMEAWKRSGMPRQWVLEHLDGWDDLKFVAFLKKVKASPFWPLDVEEIEAYLDLLGYELRAERP